MKAKVQARSTAFGVAKIESAAGEWGYPGNLQPFQFQEKIFYRRGDSTEETLYFGDSNIEQYWPRIDRLMADHPGKTKSAIFATQGGCPPIPKVREAKHPECIGLVTTVANLAKDPSISTVVVAAQWYYYLSGSGWRYEEGGFRDELKVGSEGASRAYEALGRMLLSFKNQRKKVYLVLNIPVGSELDPKDMVQRDLFHGEFRFLTGGIDKSAFVERTKGVVSRLREVGIRSGATIIDPVEYLCSETRCPAVTSDGEPIYKDEAHLRPSFVRRSVTYLDRTIAAP
jgi:hypothetical protein